MSRTIKFPAAAAVLGVALASVATTSAAADTSRAAAEPCVQKIAVVNNGGYVMNFKVVSRTNFESPSTTNHAINQYKVIDLATVPSITENSEVRPVIRAVAGSTAAGDYVTYCKNGQTATYSAKGTTSGPTVNLIK